MTRFFKRGAHMLWVVAVCSVLMLAVTCALAGCGPSVAQYKSDALATCNDTVEALDAISEKMDQADATLNNPNTIISSAMQNEACVKYQEAKDLVQPALEKMKEGLNDLQGLDVPKSAKELQETLLKCYKDGVKALPELQEALWYEYELTRTEAVLTSLNEIVATQPSSADTLQTMTVQFQQSVNAVQAIIDELKSDKGPAGSDKNEQFVNQLTESLEVTKAGQDLMLQGIRAGSTAQMNTLFAQSEEQWNQATVKYNQVSMPKRDANTEVFISCEELQDKLTDTVSKIKNLKE